MQKTNNTDESNDDTDAESEEEEGKVLNEDKGDPQVEDEIDDEVAEEERDDQDQEEEEDDEGEDTDSGNMYVKSIIPLDDENDAERNLLATSSPKGNIQLCFIFLSNVILATIKYNLVYLCKLQLFAKYY